MFGKKKKKEEPQTEAVGIIKSVELKHPVSVPYEITKIKGEKRVVIKRGKINRQKKWLYWPKMKSYYWNNLSELNYDPLRKKEKLIFDVNFCEPFDADGKITRSPIVEKALINQSMDDYSEVVAFTGFELTSKQIVLMIVVALFFLPLGLSMNSMFHIVPNINVHWLPSVPHFGGK